MEDYGERELEKEGRGDEFSLIRERLDSAGVEGQLKTSLFGGYAKREWRKSSVPIRIWFP